MRADVDLPEFIFSFLTVGWRLTDEWRAFKLAGNYSACNDAQTCMPLPRFWLYWLAVSSCSSHTGSQT